MDNKQASARLFTIFSFALAVCVFAHHFAFFGIILRLLAVSSFGGLSSFSWSQWIQALAAASTLPVIFRPSDFRLLGPMVVFNLLLVMFEGGTLNNHWIVETMMMAITGLALLATRGVRDADARRIQMMRAVFPAVTAIPFILFFFAAFHKTNRGFFDAELGCATTHYLNLGWLIGHVPVNDFVKTVLPFVVVPVEFAYAFFLAWPRTRAFTIMLALPFHATMGLNGYVMFGTMYLCFYSSMMTPQFARYIDWIAGQKNAWAAAARGYFQVVRGFLALSVFMIVLLTVLAAVFPGVVDDQASVAASTKSLWGGMVFNPADRTGNWLVDLHAMYLTFGMIFLQVYCILAVFLYGFYYLKFRKAEQPAQSAELPPAVNLVRVTGLALVYTVLLTLAMGPYAGYRTASVFSMFSNMQTEGGSTNHYFMPKALQVFDHQDRLVNILAIEVPRTPRESRSYNYLAGAQKTRARVVKYEMFRHLYHLCPEFEGEKVRLSFEEDGTVVTEEDVCSKAEFARNHNPLLGYLVFFKDVKPKDDVSCPW